MSSQLESIYSDELILLAETLGEVKTRTEKLEGEFSTHAKPLEAATNALSAALSGIKALQFHVLDNNLGALSARVEEMRKAVDEQVGVIALELKKADETNAAKAGAEAETLRSEIVALQSQLGSLVTQFGQQLERVEFAAKEEAKKLQLIPGPAGAAGASLNPRGTFIDGEVYNRLDVVSWLGSSYIATVDGVTEKPSKNSNQWQTLASRGGGGAGGVGDFGSLAGVAQINQGGTGQTTRALALNALLPDQAGSTQYMLLTDGSGTVSWGAQPVAGLPSQTSNSGRLLTTNGSTASWSNAVTVSGSNATVGGTLTVTGALTTSSIVNNGANGVALDTGGSASLRFTDSATSKWWIYKLSGDSLLYFRDMVNSRMQMSMTPGATSSAALTILSSSVLIDSTTASTTASSGALVVSGGVGVGGAINAGGAITAGSDGSLVAVYVPGDSALRAAGGKLYLDTRLTDGGDIVLRPRISAALTLTAATNAATFTGAVSVSSTTASNNTSSGALVVSGGVGVAKEMYLGGGLLNVAKAGAGATIEINADSGFASKLAMQRAATNRWTLEVDSSDVLTLKSLGTTAALTMTGTTSAEFVGSIKTAAPSGGTAANWKLGTVASVSPTSPNRTIEVDIGGTIYYIHAKTTNN
jgi:hypothetical protein